MYGVLKLQVRGMVEEYEERNKHLSCQPASELRQRIIYRTLERLENFEAKPGQALFAAKVERMRMRKSLCLPALAQFQLLHQQVRRRRRRQVATERKDFDLTFHRSEKLPPIQPLAPVRRASESTVWSRYGVSIRSLMKARKKLEVQRSLESVSENENETHKQSR